VTAEAPAAPLATPIAAGDGAAAARAFRFPPRSPRR